MTKLLLRVEEAAESLNIGRTKCYQLIASGQLEAVHVAGRSVRVPAEAVERFVEALRESEAAK